MWLQPQQTRKWRSDSLEARVYAAQEAQSLAGGMTEQEAAFEGLEAVFRLMGWLYSRPMRVVVDMVAEAWGVETSAAALSGFWGRFASPYLSERMRRASAQARELANTLDAEGVQRATMELIAQKTFELMASPEHDPGEVAKLAKLVLQARKQDIDERKVALLEEKARKADEAAGVMESQLSEEEKAQRMRSIFGMG